MRIRIDGAMSAAIMLFMLGSCLYCARSLREIRLEAPPAVGDRGLTLNKRGKPAVWDTFPVGIRLQPDMALWEPQARAAADYVNATAGCTLLEINPTTAARAFLLNFTAEDCNGSCMAYTSLYTDEQGQIAIAGVFVPDREEIRGHPRIWWVLGHEFGHLLGLADDGNDVESLMSESMDLRGTFPKFTAFDSAYLRSLCGQVSR